MRVKNRSPKQGLPLARMKVLIAAGGSGGHLLPAQQLAAVLEPDGEVLFAGNRIDVSPFFQRDRFTYVPIRSAPFCLKGLVRFTKEALIGCLQSLRLMRRFSPDVVVGFGSFHSFPVLLAAAILRKKIVLFEANCLLGKVNRLFAPLSRIVAAQFILDGAPRNMRIVPLLPWTDRKEEIDKRRAAEEIGLSSQAPICLVFGGSQGADFINRAVPALIPKGVQVIHLAGHEAAAREVSERYRQAGIVAVVKSFETNMPRVYAAADYAICRSGAGTMAELIRYSLPALLIPFPFAMDDHQRINAEFLAKKSNGAKMLVEDLANPQALTQNIEQLVREKDEIRSNLIRLRMECEGRVSLKEQIQQLGQGS